MLEVILTAIECGLLALACVSLTLGAVAVITMALEEV